MWNQYENKEELTAGSGYEYQVKIVAEAIGKFVGEVNCIEKVNFFSTIDFKG